MVASAQKVEATAKEATTANSEPSYETMADIIYKLESSSGKNNYSRCSIVGKVNYFGFGINGSGKYMCFENLKENRTAVINWIKNHFNEGLTEAQLICHYNTGVISENCPYYKNYLTYYNELAIMKSLNANL